MSRLKSWTDAKINIGARMHVGTAEGITAFVFTLGRPDSVAFAGGDEVAKLIHRAAEIAPNCEPAKGDLAVFDGLRILMFRRFDERLSKRAAISAANEVAAHILIGKETPPATGEARRIA